MTPKAPTTVVVDAATAQRVLREQVASLFSTLGSATVADALLAWTVGGLFYWQLHSPWVLAWVGLHFLELLRYPSQAAYHRDPAAAERSAFWARRHWQEMVFFSCIWGALPWMMMPADNLPMTSMIVLVIVGLCSTGLPAVAARWPSVLAFVLPMNIGLISALLWHGSNTHLFLAFFVAVYLLATFQIAQALNKMLTESLLARFEKEALAEQIAEQMAATQRLSDEKTRFFASASHDLRQPLHAIALFGAVLERELQDHNAGQHANRLMQAVHVMGSSLDTMLDMSRLDAGVVQPELNAVPLKPMLQALNQLFASRAEEKGLQLRLRTTELWVLTDPHLLQRLLANLVENAIKYTDHGGVLVRVRARQDQVWIDVIDSGRGIAPENSEKVFEAFYQVHNPGRDRSQGLGMGLSIVRRLSHLLHHPMQLTSRPGVGTRFRLTLPLAQARPPALIAAATDGARTGAASSMSGIHPRAPAQQTPALVLPSPVLLLDDEVDIGDAMAALLSSHGVQLQVVTDEAAAEHAFGQAAQEGRPFAALICDYRLAEGADGLEAAHRLRAAFNPDLPFLLMTGETSPQRLQRVRDTGVTVLFKPVVAQVLLQTLAKLIAKV
ncbi:hybrid sensor histidine kinase/response regulator [Hydrogenophaga sp. PAMC20947]|uniref:ATP-binding response regulator n=1 Tax=Hydrogenophaga sp. PAMC20947 TaxID=2565558 RepID=UPI00109DC428|nr:hybrid sensor histidine kinase/response regulator [Hydrogenophaga sp. PAMC20947]QCB47835.1 hybrid sensor histidine kinase/response regulator [Hydrogenophaga sp. PAMC20947]